MILLFYPNCSYSLNKMSTVAQFRVADFGMENCSLSITVPPRADSEDHISDEPATLDIWSLPVTKKMDMQKLSWANRPTSGTLLGSLPVSFGETHRLPGYHCLSGSYQTFEFRCSTPGCKIDVMGNGDKASGLSLILWCIYQLTQRIRALYASISNHLVLACM